jgi:hypothetical protein
MRLRRLRVDVHGQDARGLSPLGWGLALIMAVAFVLVGAGSLDLDAVEARLGLAATEPFGPIGRAFGGWDPSNWPGKVLLTKLWSALLPPSHPGAVRWPAALAAVGMGLIAARRVALTLGSRAGVIASFCLFGSLGLIDRTTSTGIDCLTGLVVIGALDRILSKGSDWVAGLWAGLALLVGGWPAVAVVLLPIVVLGRPGATLSGRLLFPPFIAFVAWSVWSWRVAPAVAWGAALTLPLKEGLAWWLPAQVLLAGLPWTPFAPLALWPGVRLGWGPQGDSLVRTWLSVAVASLLGGTLIPGLATPARLVALVGLLVIAAAALDRAWVGLGVRLPHRTFSAIAGAVCLISGLAALLAGTYLAASLAYYRPPAIALIAIGSIATTSSVAAAIERQPKLVISAVWLVAVGIKIAHVGIYAPEWSYRFGQGPWGRAVAQWVPPQWPIYALHSWPADFALATNRPFRQLADSRLLNFEPQDRPMFVLLEPGEYAYWDRNAPEVSKVREFRGPRGEVVVLARTHPRSRILPVRNEWQTLREEE